MDRELKINLYFKLPLLWLSSCFLILIGNLQSAYANKETHGNLRPYQTHCGAIQLKTNYSQILEICLAENNNGPEALSQYLIVKSKLETQTFLLGRIENILDTHSQNLHLKTIQKIFKTFESFVAYGTLKVIYESAESLRMRSPYRLEGTLPTGEVFVTDRLSSKM